MSKDADDKTQILSRPAAPVKAPPALLNCVDTSVLKDGRGAKISLGSERDEEIVTIGRAEGNQVSLHAQGVSRNHARMFQENGQWMVEDLGSTNGTRINNSKLESKQSLNDGDTVAFGRACYKFQLNPGGASTGVDIDLGAHEQTMIMRPAEQQAAASAATRSEPIAAPAARNTSGVPASKSSGTAVLWIVVAVALAVLVVGGAKLLDLF